LSDQSGAFLFWCFAWVYSDFVTCWYGYFCYSWANDSCLSWCLGGAGGGEGCSSVISNCLASNTQHDLKGFIIGIIEKKGFNRSLQ